ncbi:MAG: IPT/TIG domain-containing protein [Verrucomicrobiota bacterium]
MNFKSLFFTLICLAAALGGENAFGQSITTFTPQFGTVGEQVRIEGSGFVGVTNVTFFNNKGAAGSVISDSQINVLVPAGAVTGPVTLKKPGNFPVSSAIDFTVIGQEPYVTDFSPTSGAGGTVVTLNGVHFTGVTNASFNGTKGTITQLTSDTQIMISAPAGVSTGPIRLTRSNLTFTTSSNFFAPVSVTSFSPGLGRLGTNLVITGKNFAGTTAVKFNGVGAAFTIDSNSQITTALPAGANTGLINVTAPGGQAFSSSNFVVLPTILGFSPFVGNTGTNVTLTGANFLGNPVVKFNGGPNATIVGTPTANQIVATVPANTTSGPISVTTTNGSVTTTTNFFVVPAIISFAPTFAAPGASVTLTGANFTNASAVSFNGVSATFSVVNNTSISATVPAGATSGKISVTTPGGMAISAANFFVPPVVSGFNPSSGIAGNSVTVTGTSFTNATLVKFNGVNATSFSLINNSQLTVIVPTNATTGPISVVAPGGTGSSAANFVIDVVTVSISRLTNAVAISWPSSATGFALQASTNLGSTNWIAVTNVPVVANGKNTVTNSTTNTATFFRLRK